MVLDKVRWGIIGCGNVTEVKSGPPLQLTHNSELVAVMRRNGALAEDYARRHNVAKWYSDADQLIADQDVNAVYIATPPETHLFYAIKAMKAGKVAYVEKPMGRNYVECLEMIRVSEETGMPLYVAYYRRALPGFLKVKELVTSNAIGQVRLVNVRFYAPANNDLKDKDLPWRYIPELAGGGLLFDLGAHTLDYLDSILGPIQKVSGLADNQACLYPAEDIVLANWKHKSGVVGTGSWCFTTSQISYLDEVELIGDQGKVIFSTFQFTPVILENQDGRKEFPFDRPLHVQSDLMANIVANLRGEDDAFSTGVTASRTNWVMDEMVKGYYQKISE